MAGYARDRKQRRPPKWPPDLPPERLPVQFGAHEYSEEKVAVRPRPVKRRRGPTVDGLTDRCAFGSDLTASSITRPRQASGIVAPISSAVGRTGPTMSSRSARRGVEFRESARKPAAPPDEIAAFGLRDGRALICAHAAGVRVYGLANVNPDPAENPRLCDVADAARLTVVASMDRAERGDAGQFMTPPTVARFMAEMFDPLPTHVRLLDPGAGVGALTAAVVARATAPDSRTRSIRADLFEIDARLAGALKKTIEQCRRACENRRVRFYATVHQADFIGAAVESFGRRSRTRFDRVVMNPPYRKIPSDSDTRAVLKTVGIDTTNLYAAFLALAALVLEPGGELVAITPRSFCSGPYFRPFRELFFREMSLATVHVFGSRTKAFADDAVLQESVIFKAVKGAARDRVFVSTSVGPEGAVTGRAVAHDAVVRPCDPERIVHLSITSDDAADRIGRLPCTLADLGVQVSTGRVVDFRARQHLRDQPSVGTVPLIHPAHLHAGAVCWPKRDGKKPNALVSSSETADLLVPSGFYTLTKRFTSKEERRRIVAAVYDPRRVRARHVGFENHVNYFHCNGKGLGAAIANGLACFLNSSVVDAYFRQFSGHTQVNAADLRRLRYPDRRQLEKLGKIAARGSSDQKSVDDAVGGVVGI
jgi:adenine-specific DNA-methyltransferase